MQVYFEKEMVGEIEDYRVIGRAGVDLRHQEKITLRLPERLSIEFHGNPGVNDMVMTQPMPSTVTFDVERRSIRISELIMSSAKDSRNDILSRHGVPLRHESYKSESMMEEVFTWNALHIQSLADYELIFDLDYFHPV